ncbi:MAG: hypothetical protein AAGG56_10425 [Pseudomonadota bacterium]
MPLRRRSVSHIGLGCLLSLAACSSVNPAGLGMVSRLDPLNTPPQEITFAVGVPDTVRLTDEDAVFHIALLDTGTGTIPLVEARVPLDLSRASPGEPLSPSESEVVYLARIAPSNAARIARAQSDIKAMRAQGIQGRGSLGVTLVGGCLLDPQLTALPVSTWIQSNPDQGFVALTRQTDLFEVLDPEDAERLRAQLGPCGGPES